MSVRAKMRFERLVEETYSPSFPKQATAKFTCVYDETLPEDQSFQKATPFGNAEFRIDNPAALEQLTPGKSYYFEITPAD